MKIASLSSLINIVVLSLLVNRAKSDNGKENCTATSHGAIKNEPELLVEVFDDSSMPGYFTLDFKSGMFEGWTGITAWCVDLSRNIQEGMYNMDSFSSLGNYTKNFMGKHGVDKPEFLPAVNYLINEHKVGSDVDSCKIDGTDTSRIVSTADFQTAIWKLIDLEPHTHESIEGENECVVNFLVDTATANNDDYELDCGKDETIVGLLLFVDNDDTQLIEKQVLIAEILLKDTGICVCPGGAKTQSPTTSPTPPTSSPSANGDPHVISWSGEKYDYHGICDLVLLYNPNFRDGIGMNVHIRSKKWKQWSYISTAVIAIGLDTFEVSGTHDGNTYWINGIQREHIMHNLPHNQDEEQEDEELTIAGYPIKYKRVHANVREYSIKIRTGESIVIKTWKAFVRVDFVGVPREEDFEGSYGLMGSFPNGIMVGRDLVTEISDINDFGQQWQVGFADGRDPQLFHSSEGPQFPSHCELPTKTALRRRLSTSEISRKEAEQACSHISDQNEFDQCVFDVMVTNDEDSVNAY